MVQGYYTLEEAAKILDMSQDRLNQMAQRREIRAFADRGTWRFRTQDIEELARRMGKGSMPDLQLGESKVLRGPATPGQRPSPRPGASPSPKPGGSSATRQPDDVFNFDVGGPSSSMASEDIVVDIPSSRKAGGRSSSRISPAPKPGSDSDVKLVPDGSDVDFKIAPADSDVRLEDPSRSGIKSPSSSGVRPAPSSKKRPADSGSQRRRTGSGPQPGPDAGVRLIPMDEGGVAPPRTPADSDIRMEPAKSPADSDIRITPADSDIRLTPADSGIRTEPGGPSSSRQKGWERTGQMPAESIIGGERATPGAFPRAQRPTQPQPTEEIDLDAELKKAEEAARARPREKVRPTTPQPTDFELAPPGPIDLNEDATSLDIPSQPDDQVALGERPADLTASGVDSGINLSSPADSGIDLEKAAPPADAGEQIEFELSLDDVPATPKPAQSAQDSSSEFELALDDPAGSRVAADAGEEDSSSEFELSLDVEGTPPPVAAGEDDSSSEFELTLDETAGLTPERTGVRQEAEQDIFETDFEVPALEGEAGAPAEEGATGEDSDTALESSDFDLSLVDDSGSQVVAVDEEEADESSATIARAEGGLDEEAADEVDELLQDDLGGVEAPEEEELLEEEPALAAAPAAAPADWGILPAVVLIPTVLIMFLVGAMSFELLHGMWGYRQPAGAAGGLVKWVAKQLGEKVSE